MSFWWTATVLGVTKKENRYDAPVTVQVVDEHGNVLSSHKTDNVGEDILGRFHEFKELSLTGEELFYLAGEFTLRLIVEDRLAKKTVTRDLHFIGYEP